MEVVARFADGEIVVTGPEDWLDEVMSATQEQARTVLSRIDPYADTTFKGRELAPLRDAFRAYEESSEPRKSSDVTATVRRVISLLEKAAAENVVVEFVGD